MGRALSNFVNDADMLGTTLAAYAKSVVCEVIGVGRAGSLVDWEGGAEKRAYVSLYSAEQILNWRVERVNGRNVPTLIVLHELVEDRQAACADADAFEAAKIEQIRVLKLVDASSLRVDGKKAEGSGSGGEMRDCHCEVEIWRQKAAANGRRKTQPSGAKIEWELVETLVPQRLGKPLPLIPFVFRGPRHSRPEIDRPPLCDIIAVNLDHYRLDADYKRGLGVGNGGCFGGFSGV